jgi:hypothetical protein
MQEQKFETVKPHVLNFLRKNYWKIKDLMSWEDAVGEAQLQFVRTIKRLEKRQCKIENEKHLMSLFKTSWSRHFITLANKATKERINLVDQEKLTDFTGEYENNQYVQFLIEAAPKDIKQILGIMFNAQEELVQILQHTYRTDQYQCNKKLSQLLGQSDKDWIAELIEYFDL